MPRAITNVATIGWLASGCGLSAGDIPFVEGDDVVLSVPRARAGADAIHGEAHGLVTQVPAAIDGWVGDVVDEIAAVVAALEDHRETRRDGAFRLYGPFDDPDGRDLAWLVKIDDRREAAAFEVWVGPPGAGEAEVALAMHGHVTVTDERRVGDVTLEYDVIDGHPELRPEGRRLAGAVTVAFDRDDDGARIELRFVDFVRDATADPPWRAAEPLVHERDADEGGSLRTVLRVDDAVVGLFGELHVGEIELDARWDASAAGRIRARAPRSANPDSTLSGSDLLLHECFEPAGGLTYRELNEPYAADRPAYGFGDASTCVFADADLDAT